MKRKKKIPVGYLERRKTWGKNREEILQIVSTGRYSYSEIVLKSPVKDTATLNHLKKLEDDNLIEKNHDGKKSYYILLKKGKETINEILRKNQEYLVGLKDIGDTYFAPRSELGVIMAACRLPWGIFPHLTINKKLNSLELLNMNDVAEIEKILYEKLSENIKNIRDRRAKFKNDVLKLLKEERFLLSFNIDLPKLNESIDKESLETLEKMSEKEVAARFKAELEMMENIDDSVFD